jgi:hypothetical protein
LRKPSHSSSHFTTSRTFSSVAFTASPPFSQPDFAISLESLAQAFATFPIYALLKFATSLIFSLQSSLATLRRILIH